MLAEVSTILDLSDLVLRSTKLLPLCKAINRQNCLHEINLSGNLMTDECMLLLCSSLPSIRSLSILNLSLNHLSEESLKYLADTFTNSDTSILEQLACLDLSYNPLCDNSLPYLAIITRHLKLKTLNLAEVYFTKNIFTCFNNKDVDLYLEHLESLNISFNALDKNQITKFISWLSPQNIQEISLNNNEVTEEGLLSEVVDFLQKNGVATVGLKKLCLSRCHVTDPEVFKFLG